MDKLSTYCVITLMIILAPNTCHCYEHLYHSDEADYPQLWFEAESVYEFTVQDLDGKDVPLSKYQGFVLIITNIATHCSYSNSAFKQLKHLQHKYYASGLRILGFPCTQFLFQEPYDVPSIKLYVKCRRLNFDVFGKIDVNGKYTSELWKYLQKIKPGYYINIIEWNFTKFIIDRNGVPVERFSFFHDAEDFEHKLIQYL